MNGIGPGFKCLGLRNLVSGTSRCDECDGRIQDLPLQVSQVSPSQDPGDP